MSDEQPDIKLLVVGVGVAMVVDELGATPYSDPETPTSGRHLVSVGAVAVGFVERTSFHDWFPGVSANQ